MSSHAPHGKPPLCTVQVLAEHGAGIGGHVRALAAGLVARGVRVSVCALAAADRAGAAAGRRHAPADTGQPSAPPRDDTVGMAALRAACAGADLVHAHGLRAGLRAALALGGRRIPLVVTWYAHPRRPAAQVPLLRLTERRVARAAAVLLGTSPALVDRARARGARDARLAAGVLPAPRRPVAGNTAGRPGRASQKRAELGAVDRPLLVATGGLKPHRSYGVLLDAARAWRTLRPAPLLLVAGEGPLRGRLQHRIDDERLPVRLLGRCDDMPELLAAADVAVLPAGTVAPAEPARVALHAGVPLVATDCGGFPDLVADAAELVPCGDADALAHAVTTLLADPARRRHLTDRGAQLLAGRPTEDETVDQVLSVYDELTQPAATPGLPAPSGPPY